MFIISHVRLCPSLVPLFGTVGSAFGMGGYVVARKLSRDPNYSTNSRDINMVRHNENLKLYTTVPEFFESQDSRPSNMITYLDEQGCLNVKPNY